MESTRKDERTARFLRKKKHKLKGQERRNKKRYGPVSRIYTQE